MASQLCDLIAGYTAHLPNDQFRRVPAPSERAKSDRSDLPHFGPMKDPFFGYYPPARRTHAFGCE